MLNRTCVALHGESLPCESLRLCLCPSSPSSSSSLGASLPGNGVAGDAGDRIPRGVPGRLLRPCVYSVPGSSAQRTERAGDASRRWRRLPRGSSSESTRAWRGPLRPIEDDHGEDVDEENEAGEPMSLLSADRPRSNSSSFRMDGPMPSGVGG